MYTGLKHLHLTAILLSFAVALVAFIACLRKSDLAEKKWLKILPHIFYTIAVITAIIIWVTQNVYSADWLASKIIGFVLYVLSISYALKWAKNDRMRVIGMISALAWLLLTASVAYSKSSLF